MNTVERARRAAAMTAYLVWRGYDPEMIPRIVEFLLPTQRMASIPRDAIRDEDEAALFAMTGLD